MTWALVGLAVLLAGLAAYAVHAALSGKDGQLADRDLREASDRRADKLQGERDGEHARAETLETQNADLSARLARVVDERTTLAAEVARLKIKLAATTPVGPDGAAIVNDEFSTPILGDALEKPE